MILFPQILALAGCFGGNSEKTNPLTRPYNCAPDALASGVGSQGVASIFNVDPMVASGNPSLGPTFRGLDAYRSNVALSNLGGRGVLEGAYVDVRNGYSCGQWFGAFDQSNQFVYPHSDPRFQEAMSYYIGDRFRASQDQAGYLEPKIPVRIVVHCMVRDNAYYSRYKTSSGQNQGLVCLGDSRATPGASYGDDAIVTAHELQHGTTIDTYSPNQYLNQYWYDEAGAINEGISDFMSLVFADPMTPQLPPPLDPRVFSRWALGTFFPGFEATRGVHQCPAYDADYPRCGGFSSATQFAVGSTGSTISYVYPDGLGWPYAKKSFDGPTYDAKNAFVKYRSQEEIHNTGVLIAGALWDMYEAIKANHGGDFGIAQLLVTQVLHEGIKHLPKPTLTKLSPVTFRGLASAIVDASSVLNFSNSDQNAIVQAFTQRGIYGGPQLASNWANPVVGTTPKVELMDDPNVLQSWLARMGGNPRIVTQGISTGMNRKLDPGEVVAVWFDIPNQSDHTAGSVQVTLTVAAASASHISVLDGSANVGPISATQAQIIYSKIHGKNIVSALSTQDPNYSVPTGNSYFLTNPFYKSSWNTAIWLKVSPSAPHGTTVTFQVEALPSNGSASSIEFQAVIN